jgi:hypothetical protein
LKAAKAEELDSLVTLSDVPFYDDGTDIIKDRTVLKKLLKSAWVDFAKSDRFPSDVMGLIRFGEFGEPYGGERLLATEIVGTDGWLVFVGQKGNPKVGMLLIRVREGKGKVVGATG